MILAEEEHFNVMHAQVTAKLASVQPAVLALLDMSIALLFAMDVLLVIIK